MKVVPNKTNPQEDAGFYPAIIKRILRRASHNTPPDVRSWAGAAVLCSLTAAGISAAFLRRRQRRSRMQSD